MRKLKHRITRCKSAEHTSRTMAAADSLWTPFEDGETPSKTSTKLAGNRFGSPGGGPHGCIVMAGNEPACSGTSKFPYTRVAIQPNRINQGTESNPYVSIAANRHSRIAMASKMRSWFRNLQIASNGDIYMSPNMITFLIWLWQMTRTDAASPYHAKRGWLRYPFSCTGVNAQVQEVLIATWKPGFPTVNQLVDATTAERKEIDSNSGGRFCRDELPFRGLKLSIVLRGTPRKMQEWFMDLVRDHPPVVALSLAGIKMIELSGTVGARRDTIRAHTATVGRMSLIDPLEAIIEAHHLQSGGGDMNRIRLGSSNFDSMFKRFWRNSPGGLTDERVAQLEGLQEFPRPMRRDVASIIRLINKYGTLDLCPTTLPARTLFYFRRWVSSSWLQGGMHSSLQSPITSIEPSVTVFRSPAMVTVLSAFERGDIALHLVPAVADSTKDADKLLEAAQIPEAMRWVTRPAWRRPGTLMFSGDATIKLMATAENPLTWSSIRQCMVAGASVVVVVLRPSRSAKNLADGVTACEHDLLRWIAPDATMMGDVPEPKPEVALWAKAHVGIVGDRPEWSGRVARITVEELGQPAACDLERARASVQIHDFLATPAVDAAMRTTAAYMADPTKGSVERVAIQTSLADDADPPSKRMRGGGV